MGRYHSSFMQIIFPSQKAEGIDLGNIEIKECCNKRHKFLLRPKDSKADFILFYDWIENTFFLVNQIEMPKLRAKRSISTEQVKSLAYWKSQEIDELMDEMRTIIKNQNFIPDAYQETQNSKIEVKVEAQN